jgi:hypothetical protein
VIEGEADGEKLNKLSDADMLAMGDYSKIDIIDPILQKPIKNIHLMIENL